MKNLPDELLESDYLLSEWVKWVFSEPLGPEATSCNYGQAGRGTSSALLDDQAMRVDQSVARLEKGLRRALKGHYLSGLSIKQAIHIRCLRVFAEYYYDGH